MPGLAGMDSALRHLPDGGEVMKSKLSVRLLPVSLNLGGKATRFRKSIIVVSASLAISLLPVVSVSPRLAAAAQSEVPAKNPAQTYPKRSAEEMTPPNNATVVPKRPGSTPPPAQ